MIDQRSAPASRGFTLVEVLMAAFIIALGVLGLSALFAGTARQQQVASQTTSAVVVSNNVQAIVARNVGRLAGDGLQDVLDVEGLWVPIPTPDNDNYLSIDAADGDSDGSLYFLVDEPQPVRMVELPQSANYELYYQFDWTVLDNPPAMPSPPGIMRALPHGRIDAASVSHITVCLGSTDPMDRSSCSEEIRFKHVHGSAVALAVANGTVSGLPSDQSIAQAAWGQLASSPDDDEQFGLFFPDGNPDYSSYIVIDLGVGVTQAERENPPPAHIKSFFMRRIEAEQPLQLRSIEIESYSWRNDKLISLPNRVVTKEDSASSTGRRPDLSFSLLFRTFASGATQLGIFTYQISPVDGQALRPSPAVRAGESLYSPPERFDDFTGPGGATGDAPITLVEDVVLGHDDDNDVYYITVANDARKRWIAEPGQLLVIESSDLPVRVLRKFTLPNGRIRADLDRAPRAEGASFLPSLDVTEEVNVWAVQETVKNRRGSGTWKLSPLDFRVVQVR